MGTACHRADHGSVVGDGQPPHVEGLHTGCLDGHAAQSEKMPSPL